MQDVATESFNRVAAGRLHAPQDIGDLIALFHLITAEEGWQPGREIEAYAHRATYFGLWAGTQLVGGLQVVHPDPQNWTFPCHAVWPELAVEREVPVAHIALMAVDRASRGNVSEQGASFWELAIAQWHFCVESGIQHLWLEATPRTLRCYQRIVGGRWRSKARSACTGTSRATRAA